MLRWQSYNNAQPGATKVSESSFWCGTEIPSQSHVLKLCLAKHSLHQGSSICAFNMWRAAPPRMDGWRHHTWRGNPHTADISPWWNLLFIPQTVTHSGALPSSTASTAWAVCEVKPWMTHGFRKCYLIELEMMSWRLDAEWDGVILCCSKQEQVQLL